MRFLMLLRKELRESLPWILLAAVALFAIGSLLLHDQARYERNSWNYPQLFPGETVNPYRFTNRSVLSDSGVWLFVISIGLGLTLGVRHFWIPHFTRTWPFLLHRPTGRMSILAAKLTAATIGYVVSLGAVWIWLYWYACRPGIFMVPAPGRVFIEGCVFIFFGLVVYLATALTGLGRARWYTTRIFALAFATTIIFMTILQISLFWAFVIMVIGIATLLFQVIDTFMKREY